MAKQQKSSGKLTLKDLAALTNSPSEPTPPQLELPLTNPLQSLRREPFGTDELVEPILKQTAAAEHACATIYEALCQRVRLLADEVVTAEFPWRLRVGGMRGFRDLLLPVFHPVYGIPYVPSSSLKGVVRAWAKKQSDLNLVSEVNRLLGYLEEQNAALGAVQFLDAFPTQPCLTVDIANPQWKWEGDRVKYGAVPHQLLSLENVTLKIGLKRTSRGKEEDVARVKEWLQKALLTEGLGSHISAGYGRPQKVDQLTARVSTHPYRGSHKFELWSQGVYGASTQEPEFRPVAVRGMLRYWFRAIALGLYPAEVCRRLEQGLFGAIEPRAVEGSLRIGAQWQPLSHSNEPFHVTGSIVLEAKSELHLALAQKLLALSFHLGGVGRGSRRPLHLNRGRLRGCQWQPQDRSQLMPSVDTQWREFFQSVWAAFAAIEPPQNLPGDSNPGVQGNRFQDVLTNPPHVYLIPSPGLKHPSSKKLERGKAMDLLYQSEYKGKSLDQPGNPNVGGAIDRRNGGTPSFVVVKSLFPAVGDPYQVVTVFGEGHHRDRQAFSTALCQTKGGFWIWR